MEAPKPRKLPSKSHKCFGIHSRILTDFDINPPQRLETDMKHEDRSKPPKNPDLSPRGPYATDEDRTTARELGITVRQLRQDRANDDVIHPDADPRFADPPIRRTSSKSHKCFATHSRILTKETIDASPRLQASGRRAGSKQIAPGEYGHDRSEVRTRAELRNDAEREHGG